MLGNTPSLNGCEAKFGRGKAHAKKLRTEIASILNDDSYRLRPERDGQAAEYVFYAEKLPTVRDDWGLVFGDAVHNLRATLDHLVVQLAILGQARALTEEEVRSTEFPVLHDPASWSQVAGPRGVKLCALENASGFVNSSHLMPGIPLSGEGPPFWALAHGFHA
jgi:hypothetical protein